MICSEFNFIRICLHVGGVPTSQVADKRELSWMESSSDRLQHSKQSAIPAVCACLVGPSDIAT